MHDRFEEFSEEEEYDYEEYRPGKSRSQKKREMKALQDVGEKLTTLSKNQLKELDLPEKLTKAILEAQTMKRREAHRRQIQYIGSLMRDVDAEPIQTYLENLAHGNLQKANEFKQVEEWRDRLVAGDPKLVDYLCEQFVDTDRQKIRQLVRNINKEREQEKPPKSYRALFQYLKELVK